METGSVLRRSALVASTVSTVVAAGWTALRYLHSDAHVVAVPTALVPFAAVPGVLGLALGMAALSRVATAAGAVALLAIVATQAPLLVAATASGDGQPLVVLTVNMRLGLADAATIVALAKSRGADIIALEELTPEAVSRLREAGLDALYPEKFVAPGPGASGVGLFSRLPLVAPAGLHEWSPPAISATLDLGVGQPGVTVVVVHVPAPWPWTDGAWLRDLDALPSFVRSTPGPVIVVGDFNATLDHQPFRALLRDARLQDATQLAGGGLLPTYPSDRLFPPVIAIDHVLVRHLGSASVDSFTVDGSDHRAVVARLRIAPASSY